MNNLSKKIIKYLKMITIISLILSLTLPCYAKLVMSDGSNLVTKAEFDARLADFNGKLTTFESSVNSKIDSQVSSYLDVNGIWNGMDIIFDNTSKDITQADFGGTIFANEHRTLKVTRFRGTNKKGSGLAYIPFKMKCEGTPASGWRPYIRLAGNNANSYIGFESMFFLNLVGGQYTIDGTTENVLFSSIISSSMSANTNAPTNGVLILPLPPDNEWVSLFFVEKGDIWVGLDLYRLNTNNGTSNWDQGCFSNGGTVVVSTRDAKVY